MTFQSVFERDGALVSAADAFERAFGEIEVLEVVDMLEDGFPW